MLSELLLQKNPPLPDILFIADTSLKYTETVKILGVYIQSNLKWDKHISDIIKRCNRKLYMFRMVKQYNLPISDLVQIYTGYIQPVLEYCVPVFNGGLTIKQVRDLERIQKRVCRIILGTNYIDYENALIRCGLECLETRRQNICIEFAKSLLKNPHCNNWLPKKKNILIFPALRLYETISLFYKSPFRLYFNSI